MLRALASEIFRMRRRVMPRILIGLIAGSGIAIYELLYVSVNTQLRLLRSGNAPANVVGPGGVDAAIKQFEETLRQLQPVHVDELGVSLVAGLGAVMLIVFAASHVGTEFGWGTLRTLLASGVGRSQFLWAKLASIALFAIVFGVVGILGVVAASLIVSLQAGFDAGGLELGNVLSASWRLVYGWAPYLALAGLIAVWSRSSGAGIAAGLVIYFAEGLVMSLLVQFNRDYATIANLGLSRNVSALSRAPTVSVGGSGSSAAAAASTLPDPTQAAIVLAAYTVLFVALAFWRLRTRDVTLA